MPLCRGGRSHERWHGKSIGVLLVVEHTQWMYSYIITMDLYLFVYIWTQLVICIQEGMLLETQLLFYGGLGNTLSRVFTCSMCFLGLHGFFFSLEARMNRSINSVVQWFGCLSTRCDVLFPANTFGVRAPKSQFIFCRLLEQLIFLDKVLSLKYD